MIKFKRANELQALITKDGFSIGVLEKTIGGYNLEIHYDHVLFIPTKNKGIVTRLCEAIDKDVHKYKELAKEYLEAPITINYTPIPREKRIILD